MKPKEFGLLGLEVRDKVTGFSGVVTSVCFDLYGCIQAAVTPKFTDNKKVEGAWFDTNRLEVTGRTPVMEVPAFGVATLAEKGPAEKPARADW